VTLVAGFVHLHVHSEYSLLDGAGRLDQLIEAAGRSNMNALALTDHGVMYGALEFYKKARAAGIKPIIGCEVYQAPRARKDREPGRDDFQHHLVLLAQNQVGYRNLTEMVSRASLEGFYYKPRVDWELLQQYHEGVIALSACLAGKIPESILRGDLQGALTAAERYREIFGPENFFLELQDHGLAEQKQVNASLRELAQRLELGLVATNDAHYVKREQAKIHEVLLCIQTGKTLDDAGRLKFNGDQFYLKSPAEMEALFPDLPEALTNTLSIAERCNLEFTLGQNHLPEYPLPPDFTSAAQFLRHLCFEGAKKRYATVSGEVEKRLLYELGVIEQMGFPGYFLIVWDLVNFARENRIPVGPGRGSAAGSIVAYCLGITNIDPLKYDLLFERFLNPERVNMPDIDTDFCFERRAEVIEHLQQKYGRDHVAQIITFGTMAARAAVRDVGRVMGLPVAEVDRIAKLVPEELGITLDSALEVSPELKERYLEDRTVAELLDTARQLEGTPRHASTHAAGVVISREPLTHYLPVQRTNENMVTTQFTMQNVEEIGLLKMDILGLRTLTVMGDALANIRATTGMELDLEAIPLDDQATYRLLAGGESTGVFQLESSGMKNIIKKLQPQGIEDIIALVALYRPGPLGSGMVDDFIQRKHGLTKITYLHPLLESILKDTYGVILYQEQVMRIASDLAGFTMGQADLLRRAMGKKKPEIIAAQRENFISGAQKKGIDPQTAGEIFDLMAHFAGYGFNKSHSAAYALIAYQTAYLKAHYPVEFMAALLTSVMDNSDKVAGYLKECREMGIAVLPPDINESGLSFTVVEGAIRFGLAAVKNVGRGVVESITRERSIHGRFKDLQEFCDRVDLHQVNRRVLESLIKSGAFDSTGANRTQLLAVLGDCLEAGMKRQEDRESGQVSLLEMVNVQSNHMFLPALPEMSLFERLALEKETLGLYISGHPVSPYQKALDLLTSAGLNELNDLPDGAGVLVGGIVVSVRVTVTKKGESMAYLTLEDTGGKADILVFPRVYAHVYHLLQKDAVLLVSARLNLDENEQKLFAQTVLPLPQRTLALVLEKATIGELRILRRILGDVPGSTPVLLTLKDQGATVIAGPENWVDVSDKLLDRLKSLPVVAQVEVTNLDG